MSNVKIEESWKKVLSSEFEQPYFEQIRHFLVSEKAIGKVIFPPGPLIFRAFEATPFAEVKAVILGQDPYHNVGQAMGLSFSVPRSMPLPPSLRNVYKEMLDDVAAPIAAHGDLTKWSKQGVLMLNATLTVEQNQANSHAKIGWHQFTDAVISRLSEQRTGIVFMLWGKFAQNKAALIDTKKHHVLMAAHPSPLAGTAFLGCKHFSQCNTYLENQALSPIDWNLTDLAS